MFLNAPRLFSLCCIALLVISGAKTGWSIPGYWAEPVQGKQRITVVRKHKAGARDYFIARIHEGTKVSETEILRPILRDAKSGTSVLRCPSAIYIVDKTGTVKDILNSGSLYLQAMLLHNGFLAYDSGFTYLAVFDHKKEGEHVANWLRKIRRVHVYNIRKGWEEWSASEVDAGIPIACLSGRIETMRFENLSRWFVNPKRAPTVTIAELDVHTGHCIRSAVLAMSETDACELAQQYANSTQPLQPGHIRWSVSGVTASGGLFRRRYVGKTVRLSNAVKK